jgi:hypothetical protein
MNINAILRAAAFAGAAAPLTAGCVMTDEPPIVVEGPDEPAGDGDDGASPPGIITREEHNGIDWNGIDWNGIDPGVVEWPMVRWSAGHWTGTPWSQLAAGAGDRIDWNAVDWSDLARNGVDWQAIAPPGPPAGFGWKGMELVDVLGHVGGEVAVHERARPLFLFVRGSDGTHEITVAIPSPGSLAMVRRAADRDAALYLLQRTWQIAYGPGFWMYAGIGDPDGDGEEGPVVVEGRLGLAPALAGLGPYLEPQVAAWSSVVGALLNQRPFQLSIRAFDVATMAATADEVQRYHIPDLRGVIGRILPPPGDPVQEPVLVLIRDRRDLRAATMGGALTITQLDQRTACPLTGRTWSFCYDERVTVVDLEAVEGEGIGGCDGVTAIPAYYGTVSGRCWIDLPHVRYAQTAATAPIAAAFVDMRELCPECLPGNGR